jgi:hypothetical protein
VNVGGIANSARERSLPAKGDRSGEGKEEEEEEERLFVSVEYTWSVVIILHYRCVGCINKPRLFSRFVGIRARSRESAPALRN